MPSTMFRAVAAEGGVARVAWLALRKVISIGFTIFTIASLTFCVFYIWAGEPHDLFVPKGAPSPLEEDLVADLRLNEPLFLQFAHHLLDSFTFDFPTSASVYKHEDINDHIMEPMAFTVVLFMPIFLISLLAGWTIERFIYSPKRKNGSFVVHGLSLLMLSAPITGLFMMAVRLRKDLGLNLPLLGNGIDASGFSLDCAPEVLMHLVLPVLVGAPAAAGFLALLQRSGRMETECQSVDGGLQPGTAKTPPKMLEYLSALRPYGRSHISWTIACVLVVDIAFSYGGLGHTLSSSVWSFDIPLLMSSLYAIALLTLVLMMCGSVAALLLRRRRLTELFADWVSGDGLLRERKGTPARASEGLSAKDLVLRMARGISASKIGLASALILLVIAVLGILAPVLAADDDPFSQAPESSEDGDAYSKWLFAARNDFAVVLGSAAIAVAGSLLLGAVAAKTILVSGDTGARIIDFLLSSMARAALAIIPLALSLCLIGVLRIADAWVLVVVIVPLAVLGWAQVFILRRVRARARASAKDQGRMTVPVATMMPAILSTSFFVAKFAVVVTTVTVSAIAFWTFGWTEASWWSMMTGPHWDSMFQSAGSNDFWGILLPPMLSIMLLSSSTFLFFDRLEATVDDIT